MQPKMEEDVEKELVLREEHESANVDEMKVEVEG